MISVGFGIFDTGDFSGWQAEAKEACAQYRFSKGNAFLSAEYSEECVSRSDLVRTRTTGTGTRRSNGGYYEYIRTKKSPKINEAINAIRCDKLNKCLESAMLTLKAEAYKNYFDKWVVTNSHFACK